MRRGSVLDFCPWTRGRTTKLQKASIGFSGAVDRVNWRKRVATSAFGGVRCKCCECAYQGRYLDLNSCKLTADALARPETGKAVSLWSRGAECKAHLNAIRSMPKAMCSARFRCSISIERSGRNCM